MKWILSVFLPPIAVLIAGGGAKHFAINLFCCILGWLPGVLHAFWICSEFD